MTFLQLAASWNIWHRILTLVVKLSFELTTFKFRKGRELKSTDLIWLGNI